MEKYLMNIITCPYDINIDFNLTIIDEYDDEIIEGFLVCPKCNRKFIIKEKIPNLLPDNFSQNINWNPGPRKWDVNSFIRLFSCEQNKKSHIERTKLSLDIGCGINGEGIVNLDVYIPSNIPRNFILGSAEFLPFKDKSFEIVKSSYVIEHLLYPTKFILENKRISKNKIIIITDNSEWIGDLFFRVVGVGRIFHDEHYFRWTKEYLRNLMIRLNLNANVSACNLSPSFFVKSLSILGKLPRIGVWFYRDLFAEIQLKI